MSESNSYTVDDYRKFKKFQYDYIRKHPNPRWRISLSNLKESDKNNPKIIAEANIRLINFARKFILVTPQNRTLDEIKKIPTLYRFRCNIYDAPELDFINATMDIEKQNAVNLLPLSEHEEALKSIEDERNEFIVNFIENFDIAKKIPIMINLEIYGPDPTIPIIHNKKEYVLDKKTQCAVVKAFNKINRNTQTGQLFRKFLSDIRKRK